MSSGRDRHRGFTFIELLLVIGLLSIMVAVSIPQFKRSFDSLILQNFISDFTAFSGYAQAKAINTGSQVRIKFDLPQKRLIAEICLISSDPYGGQLTQWKGDKARTIPEGVTIDQGKTGGIIVFYPDGTSDKADLEIGNGTEKKFSVSIEPGTGYVNIKQAE